MKIYITGIAGFLGSHLADAFIKMGHQVYGCDNLIGGDQKNVPLKAKFSYLDCSELENMNEELKGVDVVYHCAATAYEGLSVFSPTIVSHNIYQNSVSVMTAAINNKVKRFIYCSSMARYGKGNPPFKETDLPNPVDPYGLAKLTGEKVLQMLCEIHNMEYVIAVPHNIIGPRQKYDDPFRNVASIMINRILQNKPPIIYGDGKQKRCFSFVEDCLQCLVGMATQKNVVGKVINIGPDEEFVTINHLAKTICKLLDYDFNKCEYYPGRPQEVKVATCSSDLARKLLGYNTQYTLEQGLLEMIEYIKKHKPKKFKYHLPIEIVNAKTPETWTKRRI